MERKIVSGIMLILLFVGASTRVSSVRAVGSLELEMTVSNTTITIGEEIDITLTLRNIGEGTVTIEYMPPLLDVYYCTPDGCFRWSDGKYFILVLLSLTLEPGEYHTETLQWNLYQYIEGTYYPPKPGTYYLWGICLWAGITTSSPIAITLVEPAIPATIDMHPRILNLKSEERRITAYVELPESYNVSDIDVSTILLNDTIPAELHPTDIGDEDGDGVPDLMVKFDRAIAQSFIYSKGVTYGEVALTIAGELFDGTSFEGTDVISVNYAGDANNDGIIDIFDIGLVSAHWYPGPPTGTLGYDSSCDFDNGGTVDIFDIGILCVNWRQTTPTP